MYLEEPQDMVKNKDFKIVLNWEFGGGRIIPRYGTTTITDY